MSAFELVGKIIKIDSTQTFNKGFRKREFVIETDGRYPQPILFQLIQEKCDMLNSFELGDTIRVSFEVKGREFNGKYFNSLEAWRIFGEKKASQPVEDVDIFEDPELFPGKAPVKSSIPTEDGAEYVPPAEPEDDLPF